MLVALVLPLAAGLPAGSSKKSVFLLGAFKMLSYYMIVCKVMSKRHLEKSSPFACWSLINCQQFENVIWG